MNVKDIQNKKMDMAEEIRELLNKFEAETNVKIYDIGYERVVTMGSTEIINVNIEVRL